MEPGPWTRRIALFLLTAVTLAGATLATIQPARGHNVAAAAVLTKQSVAGTESQPEQPFEQRRAQPSTSTPDDATMFASVAETETSQLREGLTLAQWMNLQGKNEGWKKTAEKKLETTDWPRKECLSYVKNEGLPSGAEMVRALYFYPPPAPTPAIFPTLSGQELIKTCVLAVVRVEAHPPIDFEPALNRDSRAAEFGRALDQGVRQRFIGRYGESIGMKTVPFWGPGPSLFKDVARWIPDAEIVSGYDAKGFFMPDEDPLVSAPFGFVRARLPLVQEFELHIGKAHHDPAMETTQFRRAVAVAGIDAALSQRMEKLSRVDTTLAERLADQAEEICKIRCEPEALPKPTGSDWKQPLIPLLQDWFKALKSAAPGQRAAGLLAADILLKAFGNIRPWDHFGNVQSSTAEQSKLRSELRELGASFEPGFADAFYYYSGNWLNEAKDLDADSEGGKLALVTWMSSGNVCGQAGAEPFRNVISEGEALLAKKVDSATAAQVHFMVGDAYSDIVAIAAGESGGNGEYDSSQYEGEAEADRTKALQHYRAGLAADNTSENAKDAWRQAWHLAAGLLPNERYVCFGD